MENKIYERNSIIHFSTMSMTIIGVKCFEFTALVTETRYNMVKISHCWCTNKDADYGIRKNVLLDLNNNTINGIREATASEKEAFQEVLTGTRNYMAENNVLDSVLPKSRDILPYVLTLSDFKII